jgi:putative membrane protein
MKTYPSFAGRTITTSAIFALYSGAAWAQQSTESDCNNWGSHMMGGNMGWLGTFFGALIILLILASTIAYIVFLIRWQSGSLNRNNKHSQTPHEILEERFARGEIEKDEFEQRRHILGG